MIDFNNAGPQRAEQLTPFVETGEPAPLFQAKMAEYGLKPDFIDASGTMRRFDIDKKGDKAGWYVFYAGEIAAGAFGSWKDDLSKKWCSKNVSTLTYEQRQRFTEQQARAKKERDAQRVINQAKAKQTANYIWNDSKPIVGQGHEYLKEKNIQPHYARLSKTGDLVVPELDENGDIHSLQFIKRTPEDPGRYKKKFLYLGRRDGLYFEIQGNDQIILCEGFSTGATIAESTGATVICAFDSGGLPKVARVLKEKYPNRTITVAADNDQFKPKNAGITKGKEAARILGGEMVFPTFADHTTKPTDFNDLANLEGLAAVTTQLRETDKKAVFAPLSPEATKLKGKLLSCPPPKEFMWNCKGNGFLPKGVVGVIAATGGTGKTFMLLSLGVMTAAGKAFGPISSLRPYKTLIVCGEDDQEEVERRLWHITGGDFPDELHAASVYGSVGPLMELDGNKPVRAGGFHWLEETIQKHKGLELLILDPKSRFYGLDENNNDHATQWIQSLEYLAKKYELTILFSAHTSEANSGRISQAMNRGASALVDGCRWQAGLIRLDQGTADYYGIDNPRNYVVFDTPKNNYAADVANPLYFKRTDTGALEYCNLKEQAEGGLADHVYTLIANDPHRKTRREFQRDTDFIAEIKDKFLKFQRRDLYQIIDKLIELKRLEEQSTEGGPSQRKVVLPI